VAVTLFAELMVIRQELVPLQAPLQPPNTALLAGAAVKVTAVPLT
jgi:hypothetical protein